MEELYKRYDEIVALILLNVMNEYIYCNKQIILWNFFPDNHLHRLYFNVAVMLSDMLKIPIYIQTDLFTYIKLKWKRRKTRKNLRYLTRRRADSVQDGCKTDIEDILKCVCESKNTDFSTLKEINDKYYGWVE